MASVDGLNSQSGCHENLMIRHQPMPRQRLLLLFDDLPWAIGKEISIIKALEELSRCSNMEKVPFTHGRGPLISSTKWFSVSLNRTIDGQTKWVGNLGSHVIIPF